MRLHACREAVALRIVQAGRVDHLEREIAELRVAFTAIPCHSWLIVDQCKAAANEPVEQRRFANVRPTNDCDCEGHSKP
jgi:hypothetical protein